MRRLTSLTIALLVASTPLLGGIVAPLAVAGAAVRPPTQATQNAAPRSSWVNYGWRMFVATNAARRHYGLPALKRDGAASAVAAAHSRAMAHAHSLYHTQEISKYLHGVGRVSAWGENIGWTTGGVSDLQKAFMASATHRGHILSRSFRHVAVGAAREGNKLWVTLFFYG